MSARVVLASVVAVSLATCGGEPEADRAIVSSDGLAPDVDAVAPSEPPLRPGPNQRRGRWAVALNEDCTACHLAEAAQWRGSLHHRADTNRAYREAFAREPSAFCTSCHAPEAADPRQPTDAESALGVGCVSCHVVGDVSSYTVLSARETGSPSRAPHDVTRSRDFALTGGCAGCHQFHFPGRVGEDPAAFMQTTVLELEQAAGPDASCASCHMPSGDHGMAQVRDPDWLAEALEVDVQPRASGDRVEIVLSSSRPSHAMPTGDLFRRLEVGVAWRDARGRVIDAQTVHLARHLQRHPGEAKGRVLVADDRVHLGERRIVLSRDDTLGRASSIRWWVTLQRVAEIGDGRDESTVMLESEQPIVAGVLPLVSGAADP